MNHIIRCEEIRNDSINQRKITLSVADLRPTGGQFEVKALDQNDGELDVITADNETVALEEFDNLVQKYAGPLQKAVNAAGLIPGHRYTLVCLNGIGFPAAEKITFDSFSFTTYAQYNDVVKLVYIPYRKRSLYYSLFYNTLMIFDGWQDMDRSVIFDISKNVGQTRFTELKLKYTCGSASFIEDLEKAFKNPVMIYKNYKRGKNGELYA